MDELLRVADLGISYGQRQAVSGVSFAMKTGTALGVVGESGSGKSSCARAIAGVLPHQGIIELRGERLTHPRRPSIRRRIQMVFQDPTSSLNPSIRCDRAVMQVLPDGYRGDAQTRVQDLFERVRLPRHLHHAWPHELSGGQRQRVAIARALAVEPDVIVADEATSALDVSVQATILSLLTALRRETGVGLILISHDLSVVRATTDQVLVMHDGQVVEQGPTERVYAEPSHDYTRTLLAAAPSLRAPAARAADEVEHWVRT
ncbi:ABC transporter ATP-binding protein [Nonomuraea sp. NPDC046570]|uniref:ABC transporter ATP-binding protein n=1 Tax=Nonomuraea sp. NPDC046570 TaxID=3155255 RepID=UPI00340D8B25